MANVRIENNELLLEASLEDIETIVKEAIKNIDQYKEEISVIYEKMPNSSISTFASMPTPRIAYWKRPLTFLAMRWVISD